ncbi:hypothetical protein JTB14_008293 [Gonioctena quinquepunctata]|nr:hypothetical protein JTB14_008293 [Gonioctena quinquepunctata]
MRKKNTSWLAAFDIHVALPCNIVFRLTHTHRYPTSVGIYSLVDYLIKNNEDGGSKRESQTPGKSQSTGEKPSHTKPENQEDKPNLILEDSRKFQEVEKGEKRQREICMNKAKNLEDEYFEHISKSDSENELD